MVNPTQVLYEYLTTTGTDLYALVGLRVWSPAAPDGWLNDSAAVIYEVDSVDLHPTAADAFVRVTFECFGGTGTYAGADAVYRALVDRLHGTIAAVQTSGKISWARLEIGEPGQEDPETKWKFARARFAMRIN